MRNSSQNIPDFPPESSDDPSTLFPNGLSSVPYTALFHSISQPHMPSLFFLYHLFSLSGDEEMPVLIDDVTESVHSNHGSSNESFDSGLLALCRVRDDVVPLWVAEVW
jgi:hypothetical protein